MPPIPNSFVPRDINKDIVVLINYHMRRLCAKFKLSMDIRKKYFQGRGHTD